jgi:hypothetical protein
VPFAPGGPPDVYARLVATALSDLLGQQVIVENRSGAAGTIGTASVARAAPDGYTLLLADITFLVGPNLFANLKYDPLRDFVPIVFLSRANMFRESVFSGQDRVRSCCDGKAETRRAAICESGIGHASSSRGARIHPSHSDCHGTHLLSRGRPRDRRPRGRPCSDHIPWPECLGTASAVGEAPRPRGHRSAACS